MISHRLALFQAPGLEKFISACKKIEADPNYQPDITDKYLAEIAVRGYGNAIAIQRSTLAPLTNTGQSLGMVYQVKIAKIKLELIGFGGGLVSSPYCWMVENSKVILVSKKGKYSVHKRENAEKGNFDSPLIEVSIDTFLNQKCLHYLGTDKQEQKIFNYAMK